MQEDKTINKEKIPSARDLLANVDKEIRKELKFYAQFVTTKNETDNKEDILRTQLSQYIKDKVYNSDIGDCIINAVMNALNMTIHIYTKDVNKGYVLKEWMKFQPPNPGGVVNVLRENEHYNAFSIKSKLNEK